jgi:signal transduction histidine kinase
MVAVGFVSAQMSSHVRSEVEQLADLLLEDVERLAERCVARMQESLPSYAKVSAAQLTRPVLTSMRILLEAVRYPDADSIRAEGHFRVVGETGLSQGIAADEMLEGWRILLEVVREEAHPVASRLGAGDDVLLDLVEATLQWGDRGMRLSAVAYHETEIRELERLATEQAALRRVATMVARECSSEEVFATVTEELSRLLGVDLMVRTVRFELDGTATILAAQGMPNDVLAPGTNTSRSRGGVLDQVFRTGRPGRVDNYATITGQISVALRAGGIRSGAAGPIVVDGRTWGAMVVASPRTLPAGTEDRVAQFAELVSTAISNVESRANVQRLATEQAALAEEQAALRRVATRVAEGASPGAMLDAVAAEMQALLDADQVALNRFEPGEEILVLAHRGLDVERTPVGSRVRTDGDSATAKVRRTGRPARMENYEGAKGAIAELAGVTGLRSSVSVPIVAEGKLWGLVTASWKRQQRPPPDTEERMARFAELLATAIANADSREALIRLADEQAALRRVATLVAQGDSPSAVLDTVAAEMERALGADGAMLLRYEPDDEVTVVACIPNERVLTPGTRISHKGHTVSAMVRRSGRPARIADYTQARGPLADAARAADWSNGAVGTPITVEGRLWGVIIANWRGDGSPPADTEERMAKFAELLETAIANADSRDQLTASRARLVTEADDARRRVVRDLHDGAQQRLLQTIVTLKLAQRALEPHHDKADALIAEALSHAQQGNTELRELAHGILPAVLVHGGLRGGVRSIVSRLDLPVEIDVPSERFPAEVEASAYFVVAEALTNVVKHARAERAEVRASMEDGMLRVEVCDDGVGAADPSGHGLVGLADRVTAIGGELVVESPESGGTLVAAKLPV